MYEEKERAREVKAVKIGADQEIQNRQFADSELRRELEGMRVCHAIASFLREIDTSMNHFSLSASPSFLLFFLISFKKENTI